MDFTSIDVPIVVDNCKEDNGGNSYHGYETEELQIPPSPQAPTQKGIQTSEITNEDIGSNERAFILLRHSVFFWTFVYKTRIMIVALFFTVFAVEWQPLEQLLQEIWFALIVYISYYIVTCVVLILKSKCFSRRFKRLKLVIIILFRINAYWALIALCYQLPYVSVYSVILTAVTSTANDLFLTFLIYFGKTGYNDGWSIYFLSGILPIVILSISQYYFSFWCSKGFFLSYEEFMINVGVAIGLAALDTIEGIVRTQRYVKKLQLKRDENGKIVEVTGDAAGTGRTVEVNGLVNVESQSAPENV